MANTAQTMHQTSWEAGTKIDEHFIEAQTAMQTAREWPLPTNPDNRYTSS